jgi:peptide/nickel transport system substrate-binding protein
MVRQWPGVATLVFLLGVAAAPLSAQDQKGSLVFAVESLGAQTLDPILEGRPGNAVYQAAMYDSLIGFDLAKGGVGPGRRRALDAGARRPQLDLLHPARPDLPQRRQAHRPRREVQPRAPDEPGSLASAAASMRRTIKSIEVVDDLTVKVNTTSPQIGLPAGLSRAVAPEGAIMPKAYLEKVGEEEFRKKPIGSGRGSSCATCRATASSSPR